MAQDISGMNQSSPQPTQGMAQPQVAQQAKPATQQAMPSGQPGAKPVQTAAPATGAVAPVKKSLFKRWWFWLVFVIFVLVVGFGVWYFFLS